MTTDPEIDSAGPSVKVVVSIYRPEPAYFELQLQSLIHQTYARLVIYLCIDGDPSVVSEYASRFRDSRFRWLEFDENVGVSRGFMRGLQAAITDSPQTNDLFAFCDQDDVWHLDKIEKQVAFLRREKVGLCHCDANLIDENGIVIGNSMLAGARMDLKDCFPGLLLFNNVTGMTALFSRQVALAAVGMPSFELKDSPEFLHDWWVALIAAAMSGVRWLSLSLVDYRQHRSNVAGVVFRHRGQKRTAASGAIAAVISDARPYFVDRQKLAAQVLERYRDRHFNMPWRRWIFLKLAFFHPWELSLIFMSLTVFFFMRGDRVLAGGYLRLAVGKLIFTFGRNRANWRDKS